MRVADRGGHMKKTRAFARALTVAGLSSGLAVPVMAGSTAHEDGSFPVTCRGTTCEVVVAGMGRAAGRGLQGAGVSQLHGVVDDVGSSSLT